MRCWKRMVSMCELLGSVVTGTVRPARTIRSILIAMLVPKKVNEVVISRLWARVPTGPPSCGVEALIGGFGASWGLFV